MTRTIEIDLTDLDSVERAKTELIRQITAVLADASMVDNPISISLDLRALRTSDDPQKRSIAEIGEELSRLRAQWDVLDHNLKLFDRLKLFSEFGARLESIEAMLEKNIGNISGFNDLDDIASKIDDLDSKLDDIASRVGGE